MSDRWIEGSAVGIGELREIYALADSHGCDSIHHFTEPWFPDGCVVRILPSADAGFDAITSGLTRGHVIWDVSPDERLFHEAWPEVRALFEAASRLSLKRGGAGQDWYDRKVIHCVLNSWGYSAADEQRFAAEMVRGRRRMRWHCFWRKHLHFNRKCKYGCHNPKWAA